MRLDGLDAHVELLGDLGGRAPLSREPHDAQLAGGQGIGARLDDPPRPRPRRMQLLVGAGHEPLRAATVRQLHPRRQLLACLGSPMAAAQRGARLDERSRVLEACRRAGEKRHRELPRTFLRGAGMPVATRFDLFEREAEQNELRAALAEASTGRGRLVLIEAPVAAGWPSSRHRSRPARARSSPQRAAPRQSWACGC